jgi:integrase
MGKYLRGKVWYIDYHGNGRRVREKVGPSAKLADIVLQKRKVQIAEGRLLDKKKDYKVKFEEFADEYLEVHCKSNNKTWSTSDQLNLAGLKKYFAGRYLHEISPEDIERYRTERIKKVTKSTVNRILNCLSSMYNRAIEWGKAEYNPMSKVKLYKVPQKRIRYLEREEIDKLLSVIDQLTLTNNHNQYSHLKPIVIVALHTGMRKSEILGLKWHDIDIKRNIIHLHDTKNGEKREVSMNETVQKTIIGVLKNPESQYVFCNSKNKPYGNVRRSFNTACEKAEIVDFRFHDLRHTFASQSVMSGVDLNTVRELLGHKSLQMTLRYSHLSPDHKKRAVDVLDHWLVTKSVTNLSQEGKLGNSEKAPIPETIDNKSFT